MDPSIPEGLREALAARGFDALTPVQARVLAEGGSGDLLVSARTGSGKTVAYGLALAASLIGADGTLAPPDGPPRALVVAPTRELAVQVRGELDWLFARVGGRVVAAIGGMDPRAEARALAGGCHIVVGTPGRLRDHLERGRLVLAGLGAVVLDEADEMLDLGFREELEALLDATPPARRTLLFSATLPRAILALAARYQRDAVRIEAEARGTPHADIAHRAVRVARGETGRAVVNLLRLAEAPVALVFCATRDAVRHLHAGLLERGFASVALSGELAQVERDRAVRALRARRARVCVATDVAARGLDLPDLDLVLHADLPSNPEILLHRSGRTGRAGRSGVSVLLVPEGRERQAARLAEAARIGLSWGAAPDPDAVRAADEARLATLPEFGPVAAPEEALAAAALLERFGAERVAAALLRRLRASLPAPEELAAPPPPNPSRPRPGADAAAPWFSVSIGRRDNADPRTLIPLICRAGPVRRADIGAIRIRDDHTLFEIRPGRAAAFAAAIAGRDPDEARFAPASPPRAPPPRGRPGEGGRRA